ncbi:hypothetical protein [Tepidibacter hydrothermalis]|uniref:N-terminal cleavage protein n=1 Tax=Tepidibacter hydrothermalis TaxID=3036126 RepID=A0ABY8EB11_9FIRM|nr:hypothetical protein [Tepidibacter hydrothermalis]WFD08984.1 hypothetical protein P4S50_11360 [Tepidibacter hydrothermalis]
MIELLITITLIMVISLIPTYKINIRDYKIDSFIRQLCSDIRYTRIKNMNYDDSTKIYYEKSPKGTVSYVLKESKQIKKKVELPPNTEITYGVEKIDFGLNGVIRHKGETIKIKDKTNKKIKIITIVPMSGRVLIKEGIYE